MSWLSRPWKFALDRSRALARSRTAARLALLVGKMAEFGTTCYPADTKRRLMILNMIAYLIAASTLVYALQHTFLDFEKYKPVVLINFGLVIVALLVPFSHRFGDMAGGLIIVISEYIALMLFAAYLGRSSGVQLQYVIAAAAPFVVFGLKRLWLIVPVIIIGLVLHIVSWFEFPRSQALIEADREVIDSIYVQAAITTFGLIAASVYYAFRLVENAKAETDQLLRNILPDSIVERLKSKPGNAISDTFPEATILFSDISGFVPLAKRLGAEKTVELLNAIVTEFDALADHHGIEKIKTIGDAYMAASGLPEPQADHTVRLARMALDMQTRIGRICEVRKVDVNIRIGMASGPVMAGVIGRNKFNYDVWGDTVNLAARLEGLSQPGKILVCPRCFEALEPSFQLESRGMVEVKGVGQQEAWFLTKPKA